jgi:group I intron endonuclease
MDICGVYIIKNKINKKYYIGSSVSIHKRWKKHILGKGNKYLFNSIQKYGINNFEFSILEMVNIESDRNILYLKEQYWMDLLNVNDKNCYNINKIAKQNFTEKRDFDFRKKMSQIRLELSIGSKKINQYSLNGDFIKEWKSSSEAGRVLNLESRNISGACSGDQLTAFGFIWRFYDEPLDEIGLNRIKNKRPKSKKVIQKDLKGNIVSIYESMLECSNITGYNYTRLGLSCNNGNKYKNFLWEFTK